MELAESMNHDSGRKLIDDLFMGHIQLGRRTPELEKQEDEMLSETNKFREFL